MVICWHKILSVCPNPLVPTSPVTYEGGRVFYSRRSTRFVNPCNIALRPHVKSTVDRLLGWIAADGILVKVRLTSRSSKSRVKKVVLSSRMQSLVERYPLVSAGRWLYAEKWLIIGNLKEGHHTLLAADWNSRLFVTVESKNYICILKGMVHRGKSRDVSPPSKDSAWHHPVAWWAEKDEEPCARIFVSLMAFSVFGSKYLRGSLRVQWRG